MTNVSSTTEQSGSISELFSDSRQKAYGLLFRLSGSMITGIGMQVFSKYNRYNRQFLVTDICDNMWNNYRRFEHS